MSDVDDAAPLRVKVPYRPRPHFVPLHATTKRWVFVVAHRRAGKTVALVNHLIRAANTNLRPTPPPRYAYIGPSFDAAKDLVWGYLKHYTAAIPNTTYLEGELSVTLPNGATIRLYGGALAYERMRGIYLDGAVLDEYPLLHPSAFTSVVRPCLADYRGFAIVSGTAAGEDHFHALKLRAEDDPNWDIFDIPITATGDSALNPDEVQEMRQDMSPDEFAREMLCSFDAPVEGAYYQEALNALQMQNRVTKVSPDLNTGVLTAWDLGIRHLQCIWLVQVCGRELHWIDYIEGRGKSLSHYAELLALKAKTGGFSYRAHLLPHDVEVRELATGHSRRHELVNLLKEPVITVPQHNTEDGITATRGCLGVSWFDADACRKGLARLRSYRKSKSGVAVPDESEDAADAFRTGCIGIPMVSGSFLSTSGAGGRLRRRLRGLI
jgi:phage terminase large subunit